MLTSLTIKNYALIDEIAVDFTNGFTVITGETGAGKSIILGALALVLGKRADLSTVTKKDEKCIVEASFDIAKFELEPFFKSNELDFDVHTIIRRELLPSGKSRAFVNDTPVTLDILSKLSSNLLDIHAQHDALSITESEFQYRTLDALANQHDLLKTYQETLKHCKQKTDELERLQASKAALIKENDYTNFLLNELNEHPLADLSMIDLEEELEKLSNIESIQAAFSESSQLIHQEQYGISDLLMQLRTILSRIAAYAVSYQEVYNRIESLTIDLQDISETIDQEADGLEPKPERLAEITTLTNKIQALLHKHNAQSIDELITIKNELSSKTVLFEQIDDQIGQCQNDLEQLKTMLHSHAEQLTRGRQQVVPKFIDELQESLSALGIPNASFSIKLIPLETFHSYGNTQLEFLFSANKGQELKPLKGAASGGELSRIMLSVKAIISRYDRLPTLIFDEIDTGVSGEVATKVAAIMHQMSATMQLLAITHLPQIAAKGHAHLKVFKSQEHGKTTTKLVALNSEDRIVEIAEMLSGKQMTTTALEHAKQLLN